MDTNKSTMEPLEVIMLGNSSTHEQGKLNKANLKIFLIDKTK